MQQSHSSEGLYADVEAGGPAAENCCAHLVTFRRLQEGDVPPLMELQRVLFPVVYSENFYTRLFNAGSFCIVGVVNDGDIVAVATARVAFNDEEAYIMTFGVRHDYRRQHLGTVAMQQIIRLLRSHTCCDSVTLHVKSTNWVALGFYESLGFACSPSTGYLPNHYLIDGRRWDAYKYTKPLRGALHTALRGICSLL